MTTSRVATLSPIDVTVVISQSGFTHVVSGYAEDSNIMVERGSDNYDKYVGVDNKTSRVYKADKSGTITLTLAQTSVSNDVLNLLQQNDAAARNSSGLFSVTVKDGSGRSVYHSLEAWVSKTPNSQFGSSMNTREWVIQAAEMTSIIGGNGKVSAEDVATIEALGGTVSADWIA
jgi:hypothetical protein